MAHRLAEVFEKVMADEAPSEHAMRHFWGDCSNMPRPKHLGFQGAGGAGGADGEVISLSSARERLRPGR